MRHLPFLQFRSTTNLSQYTVFQGLVNLTSRLNNPFESVDTVFSVVSVSESLLTSILGLFPRLLLLSAGELGAERLLLDTNQAVDTAGSHTVLALILSVVIFSAAGPFFPPSASTLVTNFVGSCECLCECSPCSLIPNATAGLLSLSSTLSRRLSNRGNPHPHFSHFLSMCCPHIRLQRRSSSASAFHDLFTWAARPSEMASR